MNWFKRIKQWFTCDEDKVTLLDEYAELIAQAEEANLMQMDKIMEKGLKLSVRITTPRELRAFQEINKIANKKLKEYLDGKSKMDKK